MPFTRIELVRIVIVMLSTLSFSSDAGLLEQLLMPGELAKSHAELVENCKSCHSDETRHEFACTDCHTHSSISDDITTRQGFHGKSPAVKTSKCIDCHSDHQGRGFDMIGFEPGLFDHKISDFNLRGQHQQVDCVACHKTQIYRNTPSTCESCHREDDVHKGQFGEQCASCHRETDWRQSDFVHEENSDFALRGAHSKQPCQRCHITSDYTLASQLCSSCHQLEDTHRAVFADDCGSCHSEKDWSKTFFNHNLDTQFPLLESHNNLNCLQCHAKSVPAKTLRKCADCHAAHDIHNERNGKNCESCHQPTRWPDIDFEHNRDTKFKLHGRHADLTCSSCHLPETTATALADSICIDCHSSDDQHRGALGDDCATCHNQDAWQTKVLFDHDIISFPLIGQHTVVACEQCHQEESFQLDSNECHSCHYDPHESTYGKMCDTCHTPNDWRLWIFDHTKQTNFKLTGMHAGTACASCHQPGKTIEDRADCFSCHAGDDEHDQAFGKSCENCHSTERFQDIRMLQ